MTVVELPLEAGARTEPRSGAARLRASEAREAPRPGFTHVLEDSADGATVTRTVLPCGARVLTERMPAQRSVTVGLWVSLGSRDEAPGMLGATHFLEHLLFKGTRRRSALQIAETFDEVGGESNAFTAKEHTCYYARVLSEHTRLAVDVLVDMFSDALLDPHEFDRERGVILEEIAMDRDDPEDFAFEQFTEAVLHGSPLARPIAGTPEEIRAVGRDAVWRHYRAAYRPEHLVIAAAGGLDHEDVLEYVRESLRRAGWDPDQPADPAQRRRAELREPSPAVGQHAWMRPVEQAHVLLGGPGLPAGHPQRFTMSVLNAVLGGGMSSRLFHTIRERHGLAYTTYSFSGGYSDAGYFGMYAGCSGSRVDTVAGLMLRELTQLAEHGPSERELTKVQGQLAGATVLALEDPGSRMSRLGGAELTTGYYMDVTESIERIRAVTAPDVAALAERLARDAGVRAVVGPEPAERS